MNVPESRIVISDLDEVCLEKEKLSPVSRKGYWQVVPYETADGWRGTFLSAKTDNDAGTLTLAPGVCGWCRIYVGVVACINQAGNNVVNLKLSGDGGYTQFRPFSDIEGSGIEENFWKCADMTGQTLSLCKFERGGAHEDCMLGRLRFEPMTAEEVEAHLADERDASRRTVYATNDMHCLQYFYLAQTQEEWNAAVQPYEQSDVEWLSIENIIMGGEPLTVPVEEYAFPRLGDRNALVGFPKNYTDEMLQKLVAYGHAKGLKLAVSQRMGGWCQPFPFEYIESAFMREHPECRCVDRDGAVIPVMSYAFPAVRSYVIDMLVRQAKNGFDAVQLMFHRGIPYVLFEEPFVAAFTARYGCDPRVLPWRDARVIDVRCEIITDFVRELRAALDGAGYAHVGIQIRGFYAPYDNRLLGIDPAALMREGLISMMIAHPLICRFHIIAARPSVGKTSIAVNFARYWADDGKNVLDLQKYTRFADTAKGSVICRHEGFADLSSFLPILERLGERPQSEEERVASWLALEKEFGVPVYFEIMPRRLSPAEYRSRLVALYDAGVTHVSFWDSYGRAPYRYTWNLIRRAGHPEEIRAMRPGPDGEAVRSRFIRNGGMFIGRFRPNWGT